MQPTYTQFDGNIEFYNDPRYREANKAFYKCIDLLKECGMTQNQACDWIKCWGWEDNGE